MRIPHCGHNDVATLGAIVVILLAEDVDDTREMMKLLLELYGHEVDTASNGQEAIRAAVKRVPHVILMDLCMPLMDGLAATRVLRETHETRDVPIVAVSAYVGEGDWCDRAKAAGCNEWIGKPVDFGALNVILGGFAPTALGEVT
jgi:CheY-like chemotaxis protein